MHCHVIQVKCFNCDDPSYVNITFPASRTFQPALAAHSAVNICLLCYVVHRSTDWSDSAVKIFLFTWLYIIVFLNKTIYVVTDATL